MPNISKAARIEAVPVRDMPKERTSIGTLRKDCGWFDIAFKMSNSWMSIVFYE